MQPIEHLDPEARADIGGRVIAPEDAEYDQARALFYGGMDRHPAAIVRVKDDMDVVRVVALARESGLEPPFGAAATASPATASPRAGS